MENQPEQTSGKKPVEVPDWLQEQQNKSWEPEIIISGLTLTFLFLLPFELFNFCTFLIQEYNFSYFLMMLVLLYGNMIITFFKIFFITHLILRFVWTGLIGISYAFPKGVIQEKAFKYMQGYDYPKPVELVIRLERICSMLFALPTMFSVIILIFPIFLLLLAMLFVLLGVGLLATLYISLGMLFVFYTFYVLIIFKFKHSWLAKGYATSFVGTVGTIYSSNLGKWSFNLILIPMIFLTIPFVILDMDGFLFYLNSRTPNTEWISKEHLYEEYHEEGKRFPKAFLKSEEVRGGMLKLQMAYYKQDEVRLETVRKQQVIVPDSLEWPSLNEVEDLVRVHIDDSVIRPVEWSKAILPTSGQKVWQAWIDIGQLPKGKHEIGFDKIFLDNDDDIILKEAWWTVPFVKVD